MCDPAGYALATLAVPQAATDMLRIALGKAGD